MTIKTVYGITADPSDARRAGRKPHQDAAEAKAYFQGVQDGESHIMKVLLDAFNDAEQNVFTLADVRRIIQREEW